jgi:hypothetical protein
MMPDYKSRELNIHHTDNNHRFRVLPLGDVAGLPSNSFSLSSVSNVGVENALYLPLAYVDTLAGKKSVGVELYSHSVSISATDQKLFIESKAREDADIAINSSLATESKARADGDLVHTNAIAAETAARVSADVAINAAISTETSQRQAADLIHTSSIAQVNLDLATESKARSDGDAKCLADLAIESKARSDADSKLTSDLAAEVTRATNMENGIWATVQIEAAYTRSEAKRLDDRINFLTANTQPEAIDSLQEVITKFNNDGLTYANRLSFLEGIVQELVNRSA